MQYDVKLLTMGKVSSLLSHPMGTNPIPMDKPGISFMRSSSKDCGLLLCGKKTCFVPCGAPRWGLTNTFTNVSLFAEGTTFLLELVISCIYCNRRLRWQLALWFIFYD